MRPQACTMKMEPITRKRAFRASGKKEKAQLAPRLWTDRRLVEVDSYLLSLLASLIVAAASSALLFSASSSSGMCCNALIRT